MGNKVCPYCGAHLDPGESCGCVAAKYSRLTPENRDKFDTAIAMLLKKQVRTMIVKQLEDRINRLHPSRIVLLARMPDGTEQEMSAPEYVKAVKDGADFIRALRGNNLKDVGFDFEHISLCD